MYYTHDMMHCSQDKCKLKDKCYRYWLGTQAVKHGYQYASYYYPEHEVTNGCDYYLTMQQR